MCWQCNCAEAVRQKNKDLCWEVGGAFFSFSSLLFSRSACLGFEKGSSPAMYPNQIAIIRGGWGGSGTGELGVCIRQEDSFRKARAGVELAEDVVLFGVFAFVGGGEGRDFFSCPPPGSLILRSLFLGAGSGKGCTLRGHLGSVCGKPGLPPSPSEVY